MSNLSNHFGEDASLSDNQAQQIASYLVSNAGGRGSGPIRITETNWFRSEHGREVSWSGRQKRLSNCAGCHQVQGNWGNMGNKANFGGQGGMGNGGMGNGGWGNDGGNWRR
jgi:mono/diheme cytochrome c family protein